jgi:hypothetical protein
MLRTLSGCRNRQPTKGADGDYYIDQRRTEPALTVPESDRERTEESSLDTFALGLTLVFVATGGKHAFWDGNDGRPDSLGGHRGC